MISSKGHPIPDDLPQTIAYNADGTINTVTVTDSTKNQIWTQTYTWTNGSLTAVSGWVLQ